MKNKVRVLIADDHPLMRDGVKGVFSAERGMEVVGEASDGHALLDMVPRLKPDVVIMDISMPVIDGMEAARRINKEHPGVRIVILSMHQKNQHAIEAFKAGAIGYVVKGGRPEEIVTAVQHAMENRRFVSPCLAENLFGDFVEMIKDDRPADPFDALTEREKEVLKAIALGRTTKEISEKLFISPSTVKTHRTNIMLKLNVNDVVGLVKLAIRKGLVDD